jgi:hypothetical protein
MQKNLPVIIKTAVAVVTVVILLILFYPVFMNGNVKEAKRLARMKAVVAAEKCALANACTTADTKPCSAGLGRQTCTATCEWGRCVCNSGYKWEEGGGCKKYYQECDPAKKPASSKPCGACGTQTRAVECDGNGNWTDVVWGECEEQKNCPK